jgi:hypothetical protein
MEFEEAIKLIQERKLDIEKLKQSKFDINVVHGYKCTKWKYGLFKEVDGEQTDEVEATIAHQYRYLTLLSVAIIENNFSAVQLLTEYGANLRLGCKLFEILKEYGAKDITKDIATFNALDLAKDCRVDPEIIEYLEKKTTAHKAHVSFSLASEVVTSKPSSLHATVAVFLASKSPSARSRHASSSSLKDEGQISDRAGRFIKD